MSDKDSDTSEQQQEADLSSSDVVTKYKAAADIANGALDKVIKAVKPGAKLGELCSLGDKSVLDAVRTMFKGKTIEKGLAFPTCVSPNSVAGHLSPAADDETTVKDGDVVKIDLAAHIDGFIACVAHTVVVQSEPVKGTTADALAAAHTALEAALRLVRPGKKIGDVAGPLNTIVESYGCTLVEGVLSHQLKQFVVDGNKCILNRPNPEAKVEDGEFEENEVYALDILVSTGEGKPKITDEKQTTVYKRALDVEYRLKMAASRQVFSEINKNYPTMPFSTRVLDARNCRLGMVECLNHGLLHPYPVMHERPGAVIVQLKSTVLLMPNGSDKVTGLTLQQHESEKSVADEEVKALLATSLKSKKKPKKKSKAVKKPENGAADPEANEAETSQKASKKPELGDAPSTAAAASAAAPAAKSSQTAPKSSGDAAAPVPEAAEAETSQASAKKPANGAAPAEAASAESALGAAAQAQARLL